MIQELRNKLDEIDIEISKHIVERFFICTQIALEKKKNKTPIFDETSRMKREKIYTKALGIYGESIYKTIHAQSVKMQKKIQ